MSTEEQQHSAAAAYNGDIASSRASSHGAASSALLHGSLSQTLPGHSSATVPNPASRSPLSPRVQATPALHGSPAALPGSLTAASHCQSQGLPCFQDPSRCVPVTQPKMATHAEQQHLAAGLHAQVACSAAGQQAWALQSTAASGPPLPMSGSRPPAVQQIATSQAPGNTVGQSAGQTQCVAALQRAANTLPSWAETTFHSLPDSPQGHGFLASAVMLETLGRQKQALSLHASCSNPHERMGAHKPQHTAGSALGGFSPGSPTSHKWVTQSSYVLLNIGCIGVVPSSDALQQASLRLHAVHQHTVIRLACLYNVSDSTSIYTNWLGHLHSTELQHATHDVYLLQLALIMIVNALQVHLAAAESSCLLARFNTMARKDALVGLSHYCQHILLLYLHSM